MGVEGGGGDDCLYVGGTRGTGWGLGGTMDGEFVIVVMNSWVSMGGDQGANGQGWRLQGG